MRPQVYGYLRLDIAGSKVYECETRIRRFAESEGYDLGMVFHERACGSAALIALIDELQRAESHRVVVPSLEHLALPGISRQVVETRLWQEAGAGVLVIPDQPAETLRGTR